MEPESSLPYLQMPATCPYLEPNPSSPHNPLPLPEDPWLQLIHSRNEYFKLHVCHHSCVTQYVTTKQPAYTKRFIKYKSYMFRLHETATIGHQVSEI